MCRTTITEVFEFFDEPVLYSCRDERSQDYLVVLGRQSITTKTWFFAPMSRLRFHDALTGVLSLRDAFQKVEGGYIFLLDEDSRGFADHFEFIKSIDISENELPDEGESLDVHIEHEKPDVKTIARQHWRDILSFRFIPLKESREEISAATLGGFLSNLQACVDAIGQYILGNPTKAASIPRSVINKMELKAVAVFPSSFGMEIHAETASDVIGDSDISAAIEELVTLLQESGDQDRLTEHLKRLRGRFPTRYRNLLVGVQKNMKEVHLEWGSPNPEKGLVVKFTNEEAGRAADVIAKLTVGEPTEFIVIGRLTAGNIPGKTYAIFDEVEKKKYSGRVLDEARADMKGAELDSIYEATIRKIEEIQESTGEMVHKYPLVALRKPEDSVED
ncbi:MAG: hypothetical protein CVU59_01510 [Deltaproteobacteria bacterium HGW-Deltaproteobacteria-17]|nr:MAG: hypothetical protein CVU59_01510 [Deltaproteobacteria bacterium HGW-Deltaproteobacteria-17]